MQYYFDFLHLCMYIPPTHLQYTKQQSDEEKGRNKDTRYCTRYQDAHAAICPSSSSHRMFDFLLGHTTRRKMRWMEQQIIDLYVRSRQKNRNKNKNIPYGTRNWRPLRSRQKTETKTKIYTCMPGNKKGTKTTYTSNHVCMYVCATKPMQKLFAVSH